MQIGDKRKVKKSKKKPVEPGRIIKIDVPEKIPVEIPKPEEAPVKPDKLNGG